MARKKKQIYESFQTSQPTNFMMIYWDMMDSKAWQELTAYDIQLYLFMLRKYRRKVTKGQIWDSNKENISVTKNTTKTNGVIDKGYSEVMTGRAFRKSMDNLIRFGFVKLIENGYATRQRNLYGFNDMWQKYGTKEFHIKPEWLRTETQQIQARQKKKS